MFTESKIKKLSTKKNKEIISLERNNLSIWVYKSGTKSWVYRYFVNSKEARQVPLGKFPSISLHEANNKAKFYHDLKNKGIDPREYYEQEKEKGKNKLNFQTAWKEYDELKLKSLASRKNQNQMVEKDAYPILKTKKLEEITKEDIFKISKRFHARGSLGQANRLFARLNHFFNWCLQSGFIEKSPTEGIQKKTFGKPEETRTRYLSKDEIKYFWNWLDDQSFNDSFKIAFKILLLTAQRLGTLLKAEWKDISFERKEWFIPAQNQKTKNSQLVFISPLAEELFKKLRERSIGSELVMPSPKNSHKPTSKDSISQCLKRALEKELSENNIFKEAFVTHDLRDTFSSHMNEQGYSSFVIEKILSHKLSGIMARYNHSDYHDLKKQVWFKWSEFIKELLKKNEKKI